MVRRIVRRSRAEEHETYVPVLCSCIEGQSQDASAVRCIACGHEANADHVGALYVLEAGHAVIACGAGRTQVSR